MRTLALLLLPLALVTGEAVAQGLEGSNGIRSFSWPNGDSFTGNFRNGLPNGAGTMRYANGRAQSGDWVNGCLQVGRERFAVFTTLKTCPKLSRSPSPVPLPQLAGQIDD